MIVDVHYDLIPILPEEVIEHVIDTPLWAVKIMGKDIDKAALMKGAAETYADPTGEGLLASMDAAGIDFAGSCATSSASSAWKKFSSARTPPSSPPSSPPGIGCS